MPPGRTVRQRTVTNENDENDGTTRLTRAKAASLVTDDNPSIPTKKPMLSKKSAASNLNSTAAPPSKRRAALGDVSNVAKIDPKEVKEGKKPMYTTRTAPISRPSQVAGITKPSRANSTRSALVAKDANKKPTVGDLKRAASGSGVMGGLPKKRNATSLTTTTTTTTSAARLVQEETVITEKVEASEGKSLFSVEIESKSKIVESEPELKPELKTEVAVEPQTPELDTKSAFAAGVPDLDEEDRDDPLMVAEYVVEIFEYLSVLEESTMPNHDYMKYQTHLEWQMRGILIDWLIEVHSRFHLLPETLFLAVNIIDRFLSTKIVQLDRLQLVGVTAMFIASKYEEVISPHVANFCNVADNAFDEAQILSAERFILSAINYDLSYPNPMNFLRRISKADNYDIQTRTLGKYLMEVSTLDHKLMGFFPSHVAAASMYLARLILERGKWDATITHYSGYSEEEIQPVVKLMVNYLSSPIIPHQAFFDKYASKKFLKASILTRQWAKKFASHYQDDGFESVSQGSQ
ncbi:MAG: G2/mitotic-specific cyclin [Trizodia sp. TS-e1964]|nr:MAG: G2/mitotic-specific cyclin [Trizodia sp. TS-e1964]